MGAGTPAGRPAVGLQRRKKEVEPASANHSFILGSSSPLQRLFLWLVPRQRLVIVYRTALWGEILTGTVGQFLQCKYSHHDWFRLPTSSP